ncbi:MAG: DEAD/DEAH box helicase [Thermoplasmatota archaeon]
MGAFDLLSDDILKVINELGIEEETRPQDEAIPPILDGKNTLVIAPTGIGKTEAALLPILNNILKGDGKGFKLLYITPLKALNRDMVSRIEELANKLDFSVSVRHGDTSRKERRKQSNNPPDVLITTPETLQIMFTGRKLRAGLQNVEYVIIDELNELATDERGSQLSIALERLVELTERDFQRIGLSATVGSPEKVKKFLTGVNRAAEIIEVTGQRELNVTVERSQTQKSDKKLGEIMKIDIDKAAEMRRCKELIDQHRSTLFFVNTRDTAESISSSFNLWDEDYPIGIHHGSLSKDSRIDVEERFKNGALKALVCTSSMELGIDLGTTDFVLQYQSPRQVTRWVQRVGRAGHKIGQVSKGTIITGNFDDIAEAAVISHKAVNRNLEKTDIPEEPLSVLANQLISAVHSDKKVDIEDFYKMVKRAYPFRNINKYLYDDIIDQLADIKVIWKEENTVGKRRASLSYFYDNISMIPDEKTFLMKDIANDSVIGTLDESFVASKGNIGDVITLQGKAWRVVDIEDDEVFVNAVGDLGRIPDWSGEDIPVPYEIAQEVGKIRKKGWKGSYADYPVKEDAKKEYLEYREEQEDYEIATDDKIVVELGKDMAVINACFGSKVNETLGRLFASLLSARVGESISLQTDPYRIMMRIPRRIFSKNIKEILYSTDPDTVYELLEKAMGNSTFFRWKFLHVGKKFGAIKKDIDYRSISLDRLIDAFENTPLYEEAIDKTFRDNMDIERTKDILEKVQNEEIEVVVSEKGISPMGEAGLEKHKEFLTSDRVSHAVLMKLKERLESEIVIMKCLRCGNRRRKKVGDIDKPKCPGCGSSMMVPLQVYQDEEIIDKDRSNLSSDEKKQLQKYYKLADLARVYKKRAVMALAARGIGHQKAGRILAKQHHDEDEFLREILSAEIQYARTKRFWD